MALRGLNFVNIECNLVAVLEQILCGSSIFCTDPHVVHSLPRVIDLALNHWAVLKSQGITVRPFVTSVWSYEYNWHC